MRLPSTSTQAGTIYIGASEGGIWKTSDGGESWSPVSDLALVRNFGTFAWGTQSVGALAIDPTNPDIIYAGTGNPNVACCFSGRGLGVFRSDNGGMSWHPTGKSLTLGDSDNLIMSTSTIYKIIVRKGGPTKNLNFPMPNIVVAATDLGLFRYVDDGSDTWTKLAELYLLPRSPI